MQPNSTPFRESLDEPSKFLSDTATQVKDEAAELARSAANVIDENRDSAANALDRSALALRDRAGSLPGGENITSLAHKAADKLSATADYVRGNDLNRIAN